MADSLNVSIERMKFDTRMIDYNIKQEVVTLSEYKQHLSQLPDLADEALPIEFEPTVEQQAPPRQPPTAEYPQVADPFNPEGSY